MRVEHDGRVAVLTMDHEPMHALTSEVCRELAGALRELDEDDDVGAIVLAGDERVFSAGVNLAWAEAQPPEGLSDLVVALDELFLQPTRGETPVVAAVEGHAIAGGAVLVAACHYAVGTTNPRARFGLTELAVGVPFPPGAFVLAQRRLGRDAARVMLRADLFDADEADRLGLFDERVAPGEVVPTAMERARLLAALPRPTARVMTAQLGAAVEDALAALPPEATSSDDAWADDATREALQRFVAMQLR